MNGTLPRNQNKTLEETMNKPIADGKYFLSFLNGEARIKYMQELYNLHFSIDHHDLLSQG
jgi:hypothetical protein